MTTFYFYSIWIRFCLYSIYIFFSCLPWHPILILVQIISCTAVQSSFWSVSFTIFSITLMPGKFPGQSESFSSVFSKNVHTSTAWGEILQKNSSSSGEKKNKLFWCTFGAKGTGKHANINIINSDKYQVILQSPLRLTMRKNFLGTDRIFQKNFTPCHSLRKMHTFFEESKIQSIDWPGNFPGINSAENLWDINKEGSTMTSTRHCKCQSVQYLGSGIMVNNWHKCAELWSNPCQIVSRCLNILLFIAFTLPVTCFLFIFSNKSLSKLVCTLL